MVSGKSPTQVGRAWGQYQESGGVGGGTGLVGPWRSLASVGGIWELVGGVGGNECQEGVSGQGNGQQEGTNR